MARGHPSVPATVVMRSVDSRMRISRYSVLSILLGLIFATVRSSWAQVQPPVPPDHARQMKEGLALFKEHVRPALIQHCLECHGGKTVKGGFDLSDRKPLTTSGAIDGGGKESLLYALITHAEEPHMPQKGVKLPAETIERIARWIDLGAPYDRPLVERAGGKPSRANAISDEDRRFWSFRPLAAVAPPPVRDAAWARTPVDRFVLAKLEEHGLKPNPPASRLVLIRRLSLDLIGLLPTPEEVDAFVADRGTDAEAYERLVDRLLASPHYGERWARHWMDVARFAESHGYEQDYDRPYAYHYRDFLIDALNGDMPYDQFVRWQLAGDELAPDNPRAMAATGFLGASAFPTQLTETEFESARYEELSDMTATTGSAFLGLSIGCARCHDHKFDPIPAEDYYRMAATFTTAIRSEIEIPLRPGEKPVKMQVTSEGFPHTKHNADGRGFPHFYPTTYILSRGDLNQKKGEARPSFLRVLMPEGRDASSWRVEPPDGWSRTSFRRASLANWLTDSKQGAGQTGRTRGGEPDLALPIRPRPRRHAQRLRRPGGAADPPRAARLARDRVDPRGLAAQTPSSPDGHECGLSAKRAVRRVARRRRPGELVPLEAGAEAARSRADPRHHAPGRRTARHADARTRLARSLDAT